MVSDSRVDRITDLKIIDNVGMLDGIDLEALSDEEFDKLEAQVVEYSNKRVEAWGKALNK